MDGGEDGMNLRHRIEISPFINSKLQEQLKQAEQQAHLARQVLHDTRSALAEVDPTFAACDNPATLLVGYDTVTVNKSPMPATVNASPTTCAGVNNGSVQINPTGIAPYTFSLDGGAPGCGCCAL